MHEVLLTPHAWCMRSHWYRMHGAGGQWHRMHGPCGVINTAWTVHAVSLTPHAKKNRITLKGENHMQNSYGMQKIKNACSVNDTACTMHAVSLTQHAKYDTTCTIYERFERPCQPLKGISIKNIYVPELSYPTTNSMNLKGIPNKKCSCHWNRMHNFCVRKSIISWRIRSRIKKGFSPWIRAQLVLFDEKNRGSKISWHCPFNSVAYCIARAAQGAASF
jgi:hypothetical protein